MKNSRNIFRVIAVCLVTLALGNSLSSCDKNDDSVPTPAPPVVKPDIVFYGITSTNQLIRFNANNSEVPQTSIAVTGLQAGETLTGIDFRPATGELYGIGSTSRLYVISSVTGIARQVGATPVTPALTGTSTGFDFNPTVDRIRVVSNTGENLRLHPETGALVATDGTINGVTGASITSVAYSGNTAGSVGTTLFDIDITTKKLYKQVPPNNGTLVAVGDLGVTPTGESGFDISPDGSVALAVLRVAGEAGLYRIDTLSGKATKLGTFGATGVALTGIAIPTTPVAYAVDDMNNLLIFNPNTNAAPVTKAITGQQVGENIVGIDMRPATGQLYALGSTSRLYVVNLATGALTAVGTAGAFTLAGTSFGFDFNPTVDRIRVVSNTGQNLRLNPNDGTLAATDGTLNPGTPNVSAAAYTNNFVGATSTVLHVIDVTTDKLYVQNPPNVGTLTETGALGINVEATNGFDIAAISGKAYAILTVGTANAVYSINLGSGVATKLNDFPKTTRGFALGLGQ